MDNLKLKEISMIDLAMKMAMEMMSMLVAVTIRKQEAIISIAIFISPAKSHFHHDSFRDQLRIALNNGFLLE